MSADIDALRDIGTNQGWLVCAEAADEIESLERAYALLLTEKLRLEKCNEQLQCVSTEMPHFEAEAMRLMDMQAFTPMHLQRAAIAKFLQGLLAAQCEATRQAERERDEARQEVARYSRRFGKVIWAHDSQSNDTSMGYPIDPQK